MSNIKPFLLALIGAALLFGQLHTPAHGQQKEPVLSAAVQSEAPQGAVAAANQATAATPAAAQTEGAPLGKLRADKVTSFFVRDNDSNRIQLSMLVAYRAELTKAVREIIGQKVTPLVFSVSTLPNRIVSFDPAQLRFEQNGRQWAPTSGPKSAEILPLEENGVFGGKVTDGEVHQGVVLLPSWFDPQRPITLRYGDFHYLARFAQLEQ
ncbi:MAG: hypothetical protein ONB48_14170 [candidate division KSB1 bacterium]|nr:hypothetical protein [candidate division KSB1 bacterium]MDZ7273617.1 hypothetical protein [candidate division KSB1 bacterium]MDZ7286792.1 hypothetical protein [candidate division KSB1 bacterium]MDZ7299851.1 hypothetical protein [candidate division KSB1 bacterium]MDZ7307764.1 hypothetical protein [candidate division KSB1 bacterium]